MKHKLRGKLTSSPVLAYLDFEQQFIVETDASSVTVGKVFSKKEKDGKFYLVQFSSFIMNSAEPSHSGREGEELVVVFALKKFRVYPLYLEPFKLVTNHHALQNVFN